MLISDGLTRAQFLPLWRDAMWHAIDPAERARLALEWGRLSVREERHAAPLLIAWAAARDEPLVMLPLADAPDARAQPALRATVRDRLAELGATEAYLLVTLRGGARGGVPSFLLAVWSETLEGDQHCTMQAFRWRGSELEEAPRMVLPHPEQSELAQRFAGLLTQRH